MLKGSTLVELRRELHKIGTDTNDVFQMSQHLKSFKRLQWVSTLITQFVLNVIQRMLGSSYGLKGRNSIQLSTRNKFFTFSFWLLVPTDKIYWHSYVVNLRSIRFMLYFSFLKFYRMICGIMYLLFAYLCWILLNFQPVSSKMINFFLNFLRAFFDVIL